MIQPFSILDEYSLDTCILLSWYAKWTELFKNQNLSFEVHFVIFEGMKSWEDHFYPTVVMNVSFYKIYAWIKRLLLVTTYLGIVQYSVFAWKHFSFNFISFWVSSAFVEKQGLQTNRLLLFFLLVMSTFLTIFNRVNRRNDSLKICRTVSNYVKFVRYLWLLLQVVMFKLQKNLKNHNFIQRM